MRKNCFPSWERGALSPRIVSMPVARTNVCRRKRVFKGWCYMVWVGWFPPLPSKSTSISTSQGGETVFVMLCVCNKCPGYIFHSARLFFCEADPSHLTVAYKYQLFCTTAGAKELIFIINSSLPIMENLFGRWVAPKLHFWRQCGVPPPSTCSGANVILNPSQLY